MIATELGLPFVNGDPEPEEVHERIWALVEPLIATAEGETDGG